MHLQRQGVPVEIGKGSMRGAVTLWVRWRWQGREGSILNRRRCNLLSLTLAASAVTLPTFRLGMPADRDMSALARKFSEAMRAGDDLDRAIGLWSKAIKMAPENSATWSNRGTVLLQAGRWQEARDDLDHASFIDQAGVPDPLVLNNLANAEGALGNWDTAIELYSQAAGVIDPEILAIAMANKSLACFQTGHEDAAIREVRQLLRRDGQFQDMRAFLWLPPGLGGGAPG
mmetsp:Transcript_39145/g.110870  ORF Transcript_39145/g.110870 Transcript_39145/m.110870 type:complete len:230 (-) Transcript_39145:504-1193(-)